MVRQCVIVFDRLDPDPENKRVVVHFIGTSTYWSGECALRQGFLYFVFRIHSEIEGSGRYLQRDDENAFLILRDPVRSERSSALHGSIMCLASRGAHGDLRPVVCCRALAVNIPDLTDSIVYDHVLRGVIDESLLDHNGHLKTEFFKSVHTEYCGHKGIKEVIDACSGRRGALASEIQKLADPARGVSMMMNDD